MKEIVMTHTLVQKKNLESLVFSFFSFIASRRRLILLGLFFYQKLSFLQEAWLMSQITIVPALLHTITFFSMLTSNPSPFVVKLNLSILPVCFSFDDKNTQRNYNFWILPLAIYAVLMLKRNVGSSKREVKKLWVWCSFYVTIFLPTTLSGAILRFLTLVSR